MYYIVLCCVVISMCYCIVFFFYVPWTVINKYCVLCCIVLYYTTKAVRGPITIKSINQIALLPDQYFPSIGPGIVPNDLALCPAFNFKSRWRTMQVFFRRCLWCMLAFKRARESCPIIQWGKPASVDCLTPIIPKTTWRSSGSTFIIFSAYKLASFSHQGQMPDSLNGIKKRVNNWKLQRCKFSWFLRLRQRWLQFLKFRTLWPPSSAVQVTLQAHTLLEPSQLAVFVDANINVIHNGLHIPVHDRVS